MGHLIKITDNFGDEVGVELKSSKPAPSEIKSNFVVAFVWNLMTKLDFISVGVVAEDLRLIPTSSPKLLGILIT